MVKHNGDVILTAVSSPNSRYVHGWKLEHKLTVCGKKVYDISNAEFELGNEANCPACNTRIKRWNTKETKWFDDTI